MHTNIKRCRFDPIRAAQTGFDFLKLRKIMSTRELVIAFAAVLICGVGVTFLVIGIRMIIAVTSKDTSL